MRIKQETICRHNNPDHVEVTEVLHDRWKTREVEVSSIDPCVDGKYAAVVFDSLRFRTRAPMRPGLGADFFTGTSAGTQLAYLNRLASLCMPF